MKIEIIAKSYKPSDHLKDIIEKKLEKFSRYFDNDAVAKVKLREIGTDKYAMEVTVFFSGNNMVRAEVTTNNMYNNIDIVLPKIEGQIRKHKTLIGKKIRQSALEESSLFNLVEEKTSNLVRTKKIDLTKLSIAEAIAEMELLDHTLYAFINSDNDCVNVIYKRTDGDVGLLDLLY